MANITVGAMPTTTSLADTDLIHVVQSGIDKNASISTLQKYTLPIGFIYVQMPNKDAPSDMGFGGVWQNVSSAFAGNFFRAEGENASAFESGEQAFAVDEHGHAITKSSSLNDAGDSRIGTSTGASLDNGITHVTAVLNTNVANETRPVNSTIRVWERIS